MPLVIKPKSAACRAERLARTGTRPNRSIVGPSGSTQRVRPHSNAGEEMALGVFAQVVRMDVADVALVDVTNCNVAGGDEVSQPRGGDWIVFVVVGGTQTLPATRPCRAAAPRD
ncbi:hypothetical protein PhiBTCVTUL1a_08 [Burkholderia phage phiBtTUL1a]|nr:hypothetical protein PhiBTCVTUL1a_08 [Burkholderia phage phiBtTUL1a]